VTSPQKIIFAGSPEFAVPSLRALLASHHELVGVLTQPDRPAGRGRKLRASPVKACAAEQGIPVLQPASLASPDTQQAIAELEPDLMVVVAYGLMLPTAVLAMPRAGCVNVHASLLPRWRGASPIQAAILAGDERTGVSLMRMDEGLDTGPVYAACSTPIGVHESAGELHDRLAGIGAELLSVSLEGILEGSLVPRPQPDEEVSYAPKLRKEDAVIDWADSARTIDAQIRAYRPWPVAQTLLDGKTLRCWRAEIRLPASAEEPGTCPGTVVAAGPDGIDVQTGAGVLRLLEVQLPGRPPRSAREFLHGCPMLHKTLGTG